VERGPSAMESLGILLWDLLTASCRCVLPALRAKPLLAGLF
jgi:hypothetical protein